MVGYPNQVGLFAAFLIPYEKREPILLLVKSSWQPAVLPNSLIEQLTEKQKRLKKVFVSIQNSMLPYNAVYFLM